MEHFRGKQSHLKKVLSWLSMKHLSLVLACSTRKEQVKNYFKALVIVGKSMFKGMSRKMLESCSAFLSYVF